MKSELGYEKGLRLHIEKERAAVKLQSNVGELLYEKGIELVLFRHHLIDITISEIINLHDYSRKVTSQSIDVFTTSELATNLLELEVIPSKLDIGKLANEWNKEAENYKNQKEFLSDKLSVLEENQDQPVEPRDVILYGFGRIGRLAARELIKQAGKGQQLRLRAIVTRSSKDDDIIKRASLLRNDSVHGCLLYTS